MEQNTDRLMTPEEYAVKQGISLKTVYNHINSGKVNTVQKFKKTLIKV